MGYGVMVTLQILVLPFLVRVRVAQQRGSVLEPLFLYIEPNGNKGLNLKFGKVDKK